MTTSNSASSNDSKFGLEHRAGSSLRSPPWVPNAFGGRFICWSVRASRQQCGRAISTRGPYWHGGVAGLAVGSLLLPSSMTRPGALNIRRQVFITTDLHVAVWFAITNDSDSDGGLYEVEPLGRVWLDQLDNMNDQSEQPHSYKCQRARILRAIPIPPEFCTNEGCERLRRRMWGED